VPTAVLTGVTGGWGRAVLDRFVEQRWQCAVATHGPPPDGLPEGVMTQEADLTDPSAAAAVVAAAIERFGSVEALAHIAGGFAAEGRIEEARPELLREQLSINLDTAWNMTRAVLGPMRAAGRGAIVYIGTAAMLRPFTGGAAYSISKVALSGLMQCVDTEARTDGVRANVLVAKIVDTPRNRAENPDADFSRWTTGAELAQAVEWLCSDASGPVSGAVIPAYGRA
jgi:NAD(P)-dependent dehydrogenase (short-subunit alcohol dehydrogenase family)